MTHSTFGQPPSGSFCMFNDMYKNYSCLDLFLHVTSEIFLTITLLAADTNLSGTMEDLGHGFCAAEYLASIVYK